jgi:hypothetical protein
MQGKEKAAFERSLKRKSGIWRRRDGLAYQRRMRMEWP